MRWPMHAAERGALWHIVSDIEGRGLQLLDGYSNNGGLSAGRRDRSLRRQ